MTKLPWLQVQQEYFHIRLVLEKRKVGISL